MAPTQLASFQCLISPDAFDRTIGLKESNFPRNLFLAN